MIQQANKPEFDNEVEEKAAFAEALLFDPNNPYKVAQSIYPENIGKCMWVTNFWLRDNFVIEVQKKLLEEHGEEHFLPTKVDTAREIWERAVNSYDDDQFVKLMRLYADVRGFIEKGQINIDNRTQMINPKVMYLPPLKDEKSWEKGLLEQQKALTLDSTSESKH